MKRSPISAGGGIKVAFQAGVLQVWIDEAGLTFDHVDGASGGTFNLAMMCQGMTGKQIADNWRNLHPQAGISFNAVEFPKLIYAESSFTLDAYAATSFPNGDSTGTRFGIADSTPLSMSSTSAKSRWKLLKRRT
ncbi:MAG: patatin-like phospholipase family protein [Deltaproteobacteria bacterium]|nr:patatin-like phospholipase family protein [Deltaproteobacteria bacterium]